MNKNILEIEQLQITQKTWERIHIGNKEEYLSVKESEEWEEQTIIARDRIDSLLNSLNHLKHKSEGIPVLIEILEAIIWPIGIWEAQRWNTEDGLNSSWVVRPISPKDVFQWGRWVGPVNGFLGDNRQEGFWLVFPSPETNTWVDRIIMDLNEHLSKLNTVCNYREDLK